MDRYEALVEPEAGERACAEAVGDQSSSRRAQEQFLPIVRVACVPTGQERVLEHVSRGQATGPVAGDPMGPQRTRAPELPVDAQFFPPAGRLCETGSGMASDAGDPTSESALNTTTPSTMIAGRAIG